MMFNAVLFLSSEFFKNAVSQSFLALNRPMDKKYYNSDNWFGESISNEPPYVHEANLDIAKFDKLNIKYIKNLIEYGILSGSPQKIYLENIKTNEFIEKIITSYNKYFGKKINGNTVYNHLSEEMYSFETPLFVLIHDLIHQVIESDFIQNLSTRYEFDEVTVLADQIYEDLASTLSNYQPSGNTNYARKRYSFLVEYIETIFNSFFMNEKACNTQSLKDAIEKTFHILKSELRNKINTIADNISDNHFKKIKSTLPASAKVKQLVDGFLSRYKKEMINQIDFVINAYNSNQIGFRTKYTNIFHAFNLSKIDSEYQHKMLESDIIEQSDSSALRAWMIEVLKEMKNLNHYFKFEFEEKLLKDFEEENNEL